MIKPKGIELTNDLLAEVLDNVSRMIGLNVKVTKIYGVIYDEVNETTTIYIEEPKDVKPEDIFSMNQQDRFPVVDTE